MLNRYNLLPTTIYYVLVAIVALIASIYLWSGLFNIWSRNNMEYDTFDWNFSAKNAPKAGNRSDAPWVTGVPSTCIDQRCCSTGLEWDTTLGQCVLAGTGAAKGTGTGTGTVTGTGIVTGTGTSTAASSLASSVVVKESFGNMFGQHRNFLFNKPDVTLGGELITPHNPCSFIRYN